MIKRVTVVTLPEGTDPDEFWTYWIEDHGAIVKTYPGLRRYVISRVTEATNDSPLRFWGMVESWWDSKEDLPKALQTPIAKHTYEEFLSKIADRFGAIVEEKEMELPLHFS